MAGRVYEFVDIQKSDAAFEQMVTGNIE